MTSRESQVFSAARERTPSRYLTNVDSWKATTIRASYVGERQNLFSAVCYEYTIIELIVLSMYRSKNEKQPCLLAAENIFSTITCLRCRESPCVDAWKALPPALPVHNRTRQIPPAPQVLPVRLLVLKRWKALPPSKKSQSNPNPTLVAIDCLRNLVPLQKYFAGPASASPPWWAAGARGGKEELVASEWVARGVSMFLNCKAEALVWPRTAFGDSLALVRDEIN